ncbi:hypothetical protein [Acholeplasma equifetale]|uniref:hypothetical protein n=1 Tax=Acholeplasma equifetale TaxID=264634 RepID=UPI00138AFC6B|nr:hypothetical protein [Acholeplasma equifetale]
MTSKKIQYLIKEGYDIKLSPFFDYLTFKSVIKDELQNNEEYKLNVDVLLDTDITINHTLNFPKMSFFKAKMLVFKELKLLYKDLSQYQVNLKFNLNNKKYLTVYVDMIPKEELDMIQVLIKDLKLGKSKFYLVKDILQSAIGKDLSVFLLKDEVEKYSLHMYHQGEYQMLNLDEFNEMSFIKNLNTLYAYYKVSTDQISQIKFKLLSDNETLIDENVFLKQYKFEQMNNQELNQLIIDNYKKQKGF